MTGGPDGADGTKEAEEAEDSKSVGFSNKEIVASAPIARSLTIYQAVWAKERKNYPNDSNNPKRITTYGGD